MHHNHRARDSRGRIPDPDYKLRGLGIPPLDVKRCLFIVLEQFMQRKTAHEIVAEVRRRTNIIINPQKVWDLVRHAMHLGYVSISPPPAECLRADLERFENRGRIEVIDDRGADGDHVPTVGAEVVYDLVKQLGAPKREGGQGRKEVHIGLGIGVSTRRLAFTLSRLVGSDDRMPKLVIHAISTSHSVWDPLDTPTAFFPYFVGGKGKVEFRGLFAEALVDCADYERITTGPIVSESFERRDQIDVVVTSLASSQEQHGYMYQYLDRFDDESLAKLKEADWQGDIQLRAYSKDGPIELTEGLKPVTLFELSDLAEMARQENRHVVLLCSTRAGQAKTRAAALLPLMRSRDLHVWNHLVVGFETAEQLASMAPTVAADAMGSESSDA